MSRRGTLKKIVRDVLKAFGSIPEKQGENDLFYFLAKSFFNIIENHFQNAQISPSLETIHAAKNIHDLVFKITFALVAAHDDDTVLPEDKPGDSLHAHCIQIMMNHHNLLTCLNITQALKNYVIHNYTNGFYISRIESVQNSHLPEGKQRGIRLNDPAIETYYVKYSPSNFSADAEQFFHDFFLSDITSTEDDNCIVYDFFSFTWERPSEFIRSAIVSFSIHNEGLSAINFCDNCDKMFIPERSSENRGRFCTPECQKSYHYNSNRDYIKCQSRHRNRISAMFDTLSNKTKQHPTKPKVPSANQCKMCKSLIYSEQDSININAGQCPALICDKKYIDFVNDYNKAINND